MNKEEIKILFVGDISKSFTKRDYDILAKYYDVKVISIPKKLSEWPGFVIKIKKLVKKHDITFSWFAGWHSYFPVFFSKLYKKKSIVIVGGYDAAYIPEFKYGAYTKLKEKIPANYIYKNVDLAIVVEPGLKKDIIKNAHVKGENIIYIPTGHDSEFWKPESKKENMVLTVAGADNIKRIKIKGFETFMKAAKEIKDTKFVIVGVRGIAKDYLEKRSSENIELIEFLQKEKLVSYYQKAKVYCQLSIREGLPTALCEAMLCECIPVGTNTTGIKTAIGENGFYTNYGDHKETVKSIKKALESNPDLGKKARKRIIENFPIQRREKELKKIISEMKK